MDSQLDTQSLSDSKAPAKSPVVRGARACTVCRAAKMKCVGAEDGQKKCQRCRRANAECIFEKHRRGRKPGSKLSEASKMLRRLEKGLNSAKMKSQSADPARPTFPVDARGAGPSHDSLYSRRSAEADYSQGGNHFTNDALSMPPYVSPTDGYPASSAGSRTMDPDDDEDPDKNEEAIFPAKLIKKENERNSFFRTILNPPEVSPSTARTVGSHNPYSPPQPHIAPIPAGLHDPITAGIITEEDAKVLFDAIFLRLNPFICLFDPSLHSVAYVRSRCPFLFTTLIMAGCKYFKSDKFKECQKLANDFALRAFADAWKRVEVVQAFACLTYWQDPDDNRTWTYIGYACRMAVELGLNHYAAHPPANETEFQRLERRNNERTYLVLFVHDRSLSTQTGRHWMLPEDEFIRHSNTWHQEGGGAIRTEDVIIAAFVQLRRIAAETTDFFHVSKNGTHGNNNDINYEVLLRNCNNKLTDWDTLWRHEMERANGTNFHFSILSFFRLYIRLFLNSFGIQSSMTSGSRQSPSLQALSACCSSALDSLRVVSRDFVSMSMLSYAQDSITVMTAYSAVFLLRLVRSPSTLSHIDENTANEIYDVISQTADAYHDASSISPVSTNAAYHARFLRNLVANKDIFKPRRTNMSIDPRLPGTPSVHSTLPSLPAYPNHGHPAHNPPQTFQFISAPHLQGQPYPPNREEYHSDITMRAGHINNSATPPTMHGSNVVPQPVTHATELDAHYWKNMLLELGFGEGEFPSNGSVPYVRPQQSADHRLSQQYHPRPQQVSYHSHPYSPPTYGQ